MRLIKVEQPNRLFERLHKPNSAIARLIAIGSQSVAETVEPIWIYFADYREGEEGVTYRDVNQVTNPDNTHRPDSLAWIHMNPQPDLSTSVGYISANEWLTYDLPIKKTGRYKLTLMVSSGADNTKTMRLTVGTQILDTTWETNKGWANYYEVDSGFITLPSGDLVARFDMVTDGFNLAWFKLNYSPA